MCVLRDEQKLVDVMLATDLLYLARGCSQPCVVLVSSDQDLWPAILEASDSGTVLVHVQTQSASDTRLYERMVDPAHYRKTTLV